MTNADENPSTNPAPIPVTAASTGTIASHPLHHAFHKWHTDILVDGHDVYHGFIKDISMHGTKLFLDHNLQNLKQVKLQIQIPPLHATDKHHVIEVTAKIIDSIYDSDEEYFRSAVVFQQFSSEAESAYLESRINQ